MNTTVNGRSQWSNEEIARHLEQIADLLEAQNANPYRVRAYRAAATMVRELNTPVSHILDADGVEGLRRLPTIGASLAHTIVEFLDTGSISLLERLRGETGPERVFATIAGVGPNLASRIHEQLGIETLAELAGAADDGRLAQVAGFGTRRVRAVRETLAGRLRVPRQPERAHPQPPADEPPVSQLLDVDREYRQQAKAHTLPRIAPRRFNPTHAAWLPVLHTERGAAHYTALFSNTARAHELGTLQDWVVIYRDDADGAGQWTVVTAQYGRLHGKRIVRGREAECETYYAC